ncbi:hypothetical protein ABZ797_46575 [Streptomyces antimycoticus]|uniref:hypothetical protein n=1 Tax=Streptomyces antimycoticus TaxID=68175 RepID=UPI0034039A1D
MSASSDDLRRLQSRLTRVLVGVGGTAMVFTAANVTRFATDHGIDRRIAWTLDPMVGVALGAVLIADGVLAEHGVKPGGWATALRWFAGLATWLMNCWTSIWPEGTPMGVPSHANPAGLLLHSVPPALLVVLAEAITVYRRSILKRIAELEETERVTPDPVVDTPRVPETSTPVAPAPTSVPAEPESEASPLVICGGRAVYALAVPPLEREDEEEQKAEDEPIRLSTEDARTVIEGGWKTGQSVRETARAATRSHGYVHRVFQELDAAQEASTAPAGQLALVAGGAG